MECVTALLVAHAGFNLMNLWMTGPNSVKPMLVDPGWSGLGGDIAANIPVRGCLRVGVRQSLVVELQDESPGIVGRRIHTVTSVPVGVEVRSRGPFQLGAYAQPGVRVTSLHDRVDLPSVEAEYRDVTAHPTLSASVVARWWVHSHVGMHAAVQVPIVDVHRALNFADQHVGVGVDFRWAGEDH